MLLVGSRLCGYYMNPRRVQYYPSLRCSSYSCIKLGARKSQGASSMFVDFFVFLSNGFFCFFCGCFLWGHEISCEHAPWDTILCLHRAILDKSELKIRKCTAMFKSIWPHLVDMCIKNSHVKLGNDQLSHAFWHSTIGATGFHVRVRDGILCFTRAITTKLEIWVFKANLSICNIDLLCISSR